jgi:hypothetical protein
VNLPEWRVDRGGGHIPRGLLTNRPVCLGVCGLLASAMLHVQAALPENQEEEEDDCEQGQEREDHHDLAPGSGVTSRPNGS